MKRHLAWLCACGVCCLLVRGALANVITNGSFESPFVSIETSGTVPDGWTTTNSGNTWLDPGIYIANPTDGRQAVELKSCEIWQNTGIMVNPGETIQISVSTHDTYNSTVKCVNIYAANTLGSGNKGTLLNSQQLSKSPHVWTPDTYSYITKQTTPFYLVIGLQETGGGWCEFDSVSASVVATPEPVSMILLGLGGLFLRKRDK